MLNRRQTKISFDLFDEQFTPNCRSNSIDRFQLVVRIVSSRTDWLKQNERRSDSIIFRPFNGTKFVLEQRKLENSFLSFSWIRKIEWPRFVKISLSTISNYFLCTTTFSHDRIRSPTNIDWRWCIILFGSDNKRPCSSFIVDINFRSSFLVLLSFRTSFMCQITCELCQADFNFTSDLFSHLSSTQHRQRVKQLNLTLCLWISNSILLEIHQIRQSQTFVSIHHFLLDFISEIKQRKKILFALHIWRQATGQSRTWKRALSTPLIQRKSR